MARCAHIHGFYQCTLTEGHQLPHYSHIAGVSWPEPQMLHTTGGAGGGSVTALSTALETVLGCVDCEQIVDEATISAIIKTAPALHRTRQGLFVNYLLYFHRGGHIHPDSENPAHD